MHVKKCAGYIERYIVPAFKGRTLMSIKLGDIETWLLGLKEKGALKARFINLIYMAFRTVLKEAFRLGYIPIDPSIRVGMLADDKPKRGVLSIAEAQKLFTEEAFKTAWGSDPRQFTANLLAASTGMREGEIRALQIKNAREDYIERDQNRPPTIHGLALWMGGLRAHSVRGPVRISTRRVLM
jgi:integrase